MKVAFIDDNGDTREHTVTGEDLEELIKIADKLSDRELEKMKKAIDQMPEGICKQEDKA